MKTSSAWHPSCSICDRRFSSVQAYDAHMEAKHPPTYDCTVCNRPFHAPFALEDHYRGSPSHPNCSRCGRGFKDTPACEEHHRTAHPKIPCALCGGKSVYEEELNRHYFESQNHPSCTQCAQGFKDDSALREHVQAQHPLSSLQGPPAAAVASPFLPSSTPPMSPPRIEGPAPTPVASSSLAVFSQELSKPRDTTLYSTGFTPLSPHNRFKDLLLGERRIDSPDLRLSMSYASPINEVQPPLFSPTGLPPPGRDTDRFWASHQNIQVPAASKIPLRSPERTITRPKSPTHWPNLNFGDSPPRAQQVSVIPSRFGIPSPPSSAPATYRRAPDSTTSLLDETFSSTGYVSDTLSSFGDPAPSRTTSVISPRFSRFNSNEGRRIAPPPEFHPRLYPGSIRAQGWRNGQNHNQTYPAIGMPWRSRPQFSEPALDSRSLIVNEDDDIDLKFDSNLELSSDLPTSRGETPVNRPLEDPPAGTLELKTQPAGVSSNLPVPPISYNIIPSSECTSPRSPDVSSPAGLAVLPQISPLAATPVDLINFDIPEAQMPLPESPPVASPVTVILDIGAGGLTSSPSSSLQSYTTSPQELEISRSSFDVEVGTPPQPSPISQVRPYNNRAWNREETKSDGPTPSATRAGTIEVEPSSSIASHDQDSDVPRTMESSVTSLPTTSSANLLHCRACKADTCDDITATMCGHVFCNRCIVDAVIKTSRCPLCMTPTLLYCLFRLDLNT